MTGRLSTHAFVRWWDLHAWAGVIGGLVLYVMFLTGGVTLFRDELALWEEPLSQRSSAPCDLECALDRALIANGSTPDDFWLYPPRAGRGEARLLHREASSGQWRTDWIDSERGELTRERERLSGFLYSIHFLWHDFTGQWLYTVGGLLAAVMLLTVVTGFLIHMKNLLRQFHQFRIAKSERVLWSDMHKVLGVMGLPFQLMYAYTGAFIVLGPILLNAFVGPVFGGDRARAAQLALGIEPSPVSSAGPPAHVLPLDALERRAHAARPDLEPEAFHLVHHGHAGATFEAWGKERTSSSGRASVRLREMDGEEVAPDRRRAEGSSRSLRRWIHGLHFVHFGGPMARALFLALALATCLTILSGNLVWLSRRELVHPTVGNRLLARLTAGVGAGAWVALGAIFLVSRLFPLGWARRGSAEELTFVLVLGVCVLCSLVARDTKAFACTQLAAAGALFLPVPFLAARWSQAGLFGSGPRIVVVAVLDAAILATGAALVAGARALRRTAQRDALSPPTSARPLFANPGGHDA
ncbi:MAG TPA: PepSY-associated TM helix domain-containing protein [Polyangiaceae bacterium]|nr:PepSY-associated TM helix domain-containing protein [Polyangiaceae bacterium]